MVHLSLKLLPHDVQPGTVSVSSQSPAQNITVEVIQKKLDSLDHVLSRLVHLLDVLALYDLDQRLDDGDSLQDILQGL